MSVGDLTQRQRTMLELEGSWWKYAGVKEEAVREQLGLSMTRYYVELNQLIDVPEALAHSPLVVKRLRRIRDRRRRARAAS